ncbi:MAG: Gfo/Idh/MocA family oxidoreductase [Chthoniobacteraceae bacterium]
MSVQTGEKAEKLQSLDSAGDASIPSSSNKARIKIGLVGLNFGRHIVDHLISGPASEFFELTALCDIDRERMAESARKAPVACYDNLDDILADPNVEAVGLFTKPGGRAKLLEKIVRSGRHVFTTKPLEFDPEAAKSALEEAKTLGMVIHCNSPGVVPTDDLMLIKKWEQEHSLGHPIAARAELWASYREVSDGSWYDDPESCPAAPVYRLGIYVINDLVRLWGKVDSVQLTQSRIFTQRPTVDNAQLALLFENKAIANVFASFCVDDGNPYANSMTLNYENGTIYRNAGPAWLAADGNSCRMALVQKRDGQCRIVEEAFVESKSGAYQWEHFARAIRGEVQLNSLTPDEMVEGIRVIGSVVKAQRDGGVAKSE